MYTRPFVFRALSRRLSAGLLLASMLALAACSTTHLYIDDDDAGWRQEAVPPEGAPAYRVFLVGNAGAAAEPAPVLQLLRAHLERTGERGAVVFLGDNVYCCGLPDATEEARAGAEARLLAQLRTVEDFPGRIVFVPGDRDWRRGRDALARQEAFVEAYLGRGNTFLPDDGFPGPTPVELADGVTLVALDTQWWLADEKTFGDTGEYDLDSPSDFLLEFQDLRYKYRDDHLLVVGHHPVFSNGPHAGFASWRDHLTPLPLVGSVEPLYRRFVGGSQDLANTRYRLFRRELLRQFRGQENLVYAAAHDHSLQLFEDVGLGYAHHFVVSGAGAESDYVARAHGATFAADRPGFVSLQYYDDGSVWMEAWTPGDDPADAGAGRLLFRHRLKGPATDLDEAVADAPAALPDYRDSTVTAAVNPGYAGVGGLKAELLGHHHRALWATPVRVPILDPVRTAGGLTPVKVGGSSMSTTVWFEGGDGKTYMLRSIDKEAGRAWMPEMQETFARQMVQDQVSMLHPFGAFVIPPLARAAGVFHTNPRLVFVPDDPRLGGDRNPLAGQLAMFVVRPDDDMSDDPSVGNARDVISTDNMLDEINDDNDHRVDARAFARARLFDMLLADHDRTTDNFRWAAFEPYELDPTLEGEARKQGKVYLPVPRDRDMAFLEIDGLLPRLYRLLAEPTWQDFEEHYGFIRGLNKKGLPLDRRFTAELTRADWVEIADSLRARLTDDVVDAAVRTWPAPVYERAGAETARILKARRDRLPEVAAKYYGVLASVVDVVGSDKHERFEVTRRDRATDVVVYKTKKDGDVDRVLFRRTFDHAETKEVRLYGQGGNDGFYVDGAASDGLRLIAVGGAGDDAFVDASDVADLTKRTHFYDTPAGTTLEAGPETKVTLRDEPEVNHYDRGGFQYDLTQPTGSFATNPDDGLVLGAGVIATRHGFRKAPYAIRHALRGTVATGTRAFSLRYDGHYVGLVGDWDLALGAGALNPNNVHNFYGFGNETPRDLGAVDYYRARFARAYVRPRLVRGLADGVRLSVGPSFEYTNVRRDAERIVGGFGMTPDGDDALRTGRLFFGGAEAALDAETVDDAVNPRQGFRFHGAADLNVDVQDPALTYARLTSVLSVFVSPSLFPQITLATRVGASHNVGSFPFFAAGTLGGKHNLRGYRSTRFSGRSSLFNNTEVRAELFDFAAAFGYGTVGALGFVDSGRVWADGETSRVWHHGYGGGLWLHLVDAVTLTGTYGASNEGGTFLLQMGFLF